MKLLSEFIKNLQDLKDKYGDLPVVTADGYCTECIHDDDSHASFCENGAWNYEDKKGHDCILISQIYRKEKDETQPDNQQSVGK